ncbi:tyrosine-type recombinase/integrase [Vibrio metoecus]
MLKSLIDEQLSYFFNDASSKTTNVKNNITTHEQIMVEKSSSSTNTSLGFSDALDLWVKDKSSNFHRKNGGSRVKEKTKSEKLSYLKNVFGLLWRNKSLYQISSADIDHALYIYSRYPKKRILPWSKLSNEQILDIAVKGGVPIHQRFEQSLHRVKTSLMMFFDYFWRRNLISTNPVREIRFQIEKKYNNRGQFSSSQLKQILKFCFSGELSPIKCAILLQLFGGLRNKEIEILSQYDIKEFKNCTYFHVRGSKTLNAERYVPVHPTLIKHGLVRYISEMKQLCSRQISYEFKKVMKYLNLDSKDENGCSISFYSLRHNFATSLALIGASDVHIEWLMGHAHAGTKSKYISKTESIIPELTQTIAKISF